MKAKFGILSIVCFFVGEGIFVLNNVLRQRELLGIVRWLLDCLAWLAFPLLFVGIAFGVVSICKKETPTCFRYIGLSLNLLPFLFLVFVIVNACCSEEFSLEQWPAQQ